MKSGTACPARTGDPQIHNLEVSIDHADDVEREAAIYAAFYHRGRKVFTLWTTDELARRAGIPHGSLATSLRYMASQREVADLGLGDHQRAWRLTDIGERIARSWLVSAA